VEAVPVEGVVGVEVVACDGSSVREREDELEGLIVVGVDVDFPSDGGAVVAWTVTAAARAVATVATGFAACVVPGEELAPALEGEVGEPG